MPCEASEGTSKCRFDEQEDPLTAPVSTQGQQRSHLEGITIDRQWCVVRIVSWKWLRFRPISIFAGISIPLRRGGKLLVSEWLSEDAGPTIGLIALRPGKPCLIGFTLTYTDPVSIFLDHGLLLRINVSFLPGLSAGLMRSVHRVRTVSLCYGVS